MCACAFFVRRSSCDKGAFRACPCTSPRLKDVRAFVIVFSPPSLHVRSSCYEGAFRACPCTSPLHKDERAFVFVFSPPSLCVHLSCSSLLVPVGSLGSCGDLESSTSHDQRKHRPHKTGQRALTREINLSSRKPRVFYIPSHSLVRDPRGPAQVTPTRETSRQNLVNPT